MNKSFFGYFKESMDSVGLGKYTPESLFGTMDTAIKNIGALAVIVQKYGTRFTVRQLILTIPAGTAVAATVTDLVVVAAGVSAAFYTGASIGALIYATQRCAGDKIEEYRLSDLAHKAAFYGLEISRELEQFMFTRVIPALNGETDSAVYMGL